MSTVKSTTTLELTINPNYVRGWGVWEAVRELLQNAADAHDIGHPMHIEFKDKGQVPTLRIWNEGVTIERDTLLLGTTSKANDSRQRGEFGEGFKLAWLVLLRNDRRVWCKSGGERWIPKIEHSTSYGSDLLKIDVAPVKNENLVLVDVQLHPAEWEEIKSRVLFLVKPEPTEVMDLGRDKILIGQRYEGQLYVRGLWVSRLPDRYRFGYDLASVQLDRDRRLADPWSLRSAIKSALDEAIRQEKMTPKAMYEMVHGEWEESRIVGDYTYSSSPLTTALAAHFVEQHGKDAVPVDDTPASAEAKHFGLRGVVVSKGLKVAIEKELGSYEDRKSKTALDVKTRFGVDDLDEEENKNFDWAVDTMRLVETSFVATVVEFVGPDVLGTYHREQRGVNVARSLLMNRAKLIATLVHELAHRAGTDATTEHRDEIDDIFGRMVDALTKEALS